MLGRFIRRNGPMPDFKGSSHISKFYKFAGVKATPEGFEVTLDKRTLRTPLRQPLRVKSYPLALAIAAEWQCQGKFLKPHTMPLMQMTATALDLQTSGLRSSLVDRAISFLPSDTVCFRDEKEGLCKKQEQLFAPVIRYMAEKYQLQYPVSGGLDLPEFSPETIARFQQMCEGMGDSHLVAFETAVTVTKSTALGFCLLDGFLPVKSVMELCRLEEEYQIELFGKVEGAHDLEEAQTLMLLAAARVLVELERLRD